MHHRASCSLCSGHALHSLNIKPPPTSVPLYMLLLLPVWPSSHILFLIMSTFRARFTATFWRKPSLNSSGQNWCHKSPHICGSFLQCTGHNGIKKKSMFIINNLLAVSLIFKGQKHRLFLSDYQSHRCIKRMLQNISVLFVHASCVIVIYYLFVCVPYVTECTRAKDYFCFDFCSSGQSLPYSNICRIYLRCRLNRSWELASLPDQVPWLPSSIFLLSTEMLIFSV